MQYEAFTEGLSPSLAFDFFITGLDSIIPVSINVDEYQQAYTLFSNFISNISTAFSDPSLNDIPYASLAANFWSVGQLV